MFPSNKPGTPRQPLQGGGPAAPGAPAPALSGYYAMEARNFADGQHSILDIRNAIAAEFGPIPLENVTRFFVEAEKAGTHTIAAR